MGNDPRKRQRNWSAQANKRKEKKHIRVREQSTGLSERLSAAAAFPILHCWIGHSIADTGIGWVLLSRAMPNGSVATVSFLVDSYCLGVKDVFADILPRSLYEDKYLRNMAVKMPSRDAETAEARKLLEEAVAYARGLGLHPHADYAKLMVLFGDIKAADSDARFEFGKDGKPFFVNGPNDSPQRCKQIVAILTKTCGQGGFDYMLGIGGSERIVGLPDDYGESIDDDEFDDEER